MGHPNVRGGALTMGTAKAGTQTIIVSGDPSKGDGAAKSC